MQVYYIIIKKRAIHIYFAVIPEKNMMSVVNIKGGRNPQILSPLAKKLFQNSVLPFLSLIHI